MIKKVILTATACFLLLFHSELSAQQCKVKPIVNSCKSSLPPYQYDSYAVKEVVYGAKAKKEVLEFSVYSGEEYKLVFGKTELPQEINITIYDKHPSKKDKNIVYMDESGKKDNFVCNFQPTKTGTYYIEFEIPAATAANQKGCFVMLIGIKE